MEIAVKIIALSILIIIILTFLLFKVYYMLRDEEEKRVNDNLYHDAVIRKLQDEIKDLRFISSEKTEIINKAKNQLELFKVEISDKYNEFLDKLNHIKIRP